MRRTLLTLLTGAALAYFFDPQQGEARRARAQQQLGDLFNSSNDRWQQLRDQAQPMLDKAQPALQNARERAQPIIDNAMQKAQPVIDNARQRMNRQGTSNDTLLTTDAPDTTTTSANGTVAGRL